MTEVTPTSVEQVSRVARQQLPTYKALVAVMVEGNVWPHDMAFAKSLVRRFDGNGQWTAAEYAHAVRLAVGADAATDRNHWAHCLRIPV